MKTFNVLFAGFLISFSLLFSSCSENTVTNNDPPPPPPNTTSIGTLVASPDILEVNNTAIVTFKFTTKSGVSINDSLVKLMRSDASGNFTIESGSLQDNGDLINGDEIAGDGVFSGIFPLTEVNIGNIRFAGTASATSGGNGFSGISVVDTISVYTSLSNSSVAQVTSTLSAGEDLFVSTLAGNINNYANAMAQTVTFLQGQSGVSNVIIGDANSTSLEVNFTSGIKGGITLSVMDENGKVSTRGGLASDSLLKRMSTETIPPERQTIGENSNVPQNFRSENIDNPNIDPTIIGNRNVLIFAPYEAAFTINERTLITSNLNNGQCRGFQITELVNQNATVKSLFDMTKYGLIILATHGSLGSWFLTSEILDTNSSDYINIYRAMIAAGRIGITRNIKISNTGVVATRADVYKLHHTFISNLSGTFTNSIILNNTCEGTMNNDLENAFRNKGAKTYYGYSKVVNSRFCVMIADTVSKRYARGLNSGQAFMNATDPLTPFAEFQIKGANDMSFSLNFINGDFETGTLEGYTKDGDGRVITRLNVVNPTQGSNMGIISTGLGFTTSSGSISQCVQISPTQTTLTLKWNFLSEEFLEFIGSQFQDFFEVSVTNSAGVKTVLFRKTIDQIAADFGATLLDPGSLIKVSPGIVFDRGDVYMTNWQNLSINVSDFQGQIITISFDAGDVGDSIYDTAILLDEISVQ